VRHAKPLEGGARAEPPRAVLGLTPRYRPVQVVRQRDAVERAG
jgi:hypothetical protein